MSPSTRGGPHSEAILDCGPSFYYKAVVMSEQILLVTLGDPNGLGPELVCRGLGNGERACTSRPVLVGPEQSLAYHARRLGLPQFWKKIEHVADETEGKIGLLVPKGLEQFEMHPGEPHVEGGRAAGLTLELVCDLLRSGQAQGVVTCPLNKAMLQDAGFDFPGHTEFFAERLGPGRDNICMHLGGPRLKVSLVTTHPKLADVPAGVTQERVLRCLELTDELVKALGCADAPIAVCGLNPHAGESGKIGHEEEEIISPAVEEAKRKGISVVGPLPADTLFYFAAQGKYSAVLAMYHDQGLGPLKLLHFSEAVNVTLGLPVVRTSVDHGTGYDITGKDCADLGSFHAAFDWAEKLIAAKNA